MQSDRAVGTIRQARVTAKSPTATLSVVLMSNATGSPDRAVAAILDRCVKFDAQVILVTQSMLDGRSTRRLQDLGIEIVQASVSAGRSEMCDLGMARATGSIVAVRDVADVGSASFLNAFLPVVPQVADEALVRHERVVAGDREVRNTMVADRRPRADQAPVREPVADLVVPRRATAEMAAIM